MNVVRSARLFAFAALALACEQGGPDPSGQGGNPSAGAPGRAGQGGGATPGGANASGTGAGASGGLGGHTGGGGGAPAGLRADAGPSRYALVGEEVVLDGSKSVGAHEYEWYFGNGVGWEAPRPESIAKVSYAEPGRYQAVLTVHDADGNRHASGVTISVTHPPTYRGSSSRTLAPVPGTDAVVAVSTDSDQLIVVERGAGDQFRVTRRIATCDGPRTVSVWQSYFVTSCPNEDRLGFYPLEAGTAVHVALPYGSSPFGVAASETALFASLQGSGELVEIRQSDGVPAVQATFDAIVDARAVAVLPDGRVGVTRWRSPDERGEIALVDPRGGAPALVSLAFDEQVASDAEIGGVPSYLQEIAVSPTGRELFIPSLMANHAEGTFLSGRPLTFETTVRAALSRVDFATAREDFAGRIQFDERGFAGAVAFSSHGDFAYVVMPGNRAVARVDLLTGVDAGVYLDTGFAPDGAVVTADDRFLLVVAALSREIAVYDLTNAGEPLPVARVALLETEPLEPDLLRGKRLFNDAADARLAKSGYIACAHCHLDGDSDLRVWDFTDRGEGLRNTISLLGRAGVGDGPVHWSANFDEIHDFEHDIRNAFGGSGLMADADFASGTRHTTLGDAKAGVSADLDALSVYVSSLRAETKSPHRNTDGSLSAAALRGRALFQSSELGCTRCHTGARLTDSRFTAPAEPVLHDVGTLGAGSGKRLGQPLPGLDTPTLHGLWNSAPYLHDGSAPTLLAVLRERNPSDQHGSTRALASEQLNDLVAYLLSLDGSAP